MKLVDDWKKAARWYSVQAFAAIATIQGSILIYVTPDQLAAPTLFLDMTWGGLVNAITAFLAVSGGVGRIIAQDSA